MTELLKPQNWSGGRKLVAFESALCVTLVLGLFGKMDSGALSFTIMGIVSAFVVGNAAVHIAGKQENGTK